MLSSQLNNLRVSPLYGSQALYHTAQKDFLNLAVVGQTTLSPLEFLDFTQSIEASGGRIRDPLSPKGPRTLDIDLVFWGALVLDSQRLTLPHADFAAREFVLRPVLDLLPNALCPRTGLFLADILQALPPQGVYLIGQIH